MKMRLDLSWRPVRIAMIDGEKIEYDIGVFPDQLDIGKESLPGFECLGEGVCYSIDDMIVTDHEPHIYFRRPEGMSDKECDRFVDKCFEVLELLNV